MSKINEVSPSMFDPCLAITIRMLKHFIFAMAGNVSHYYSTFKNAGIAET